MFHAAQVPGQATGGGVGTARAALKRTGWQRPGIGMQGPSGCKDETEQPHVHLQVVRAFFKRQGNVHLEVAVPLRPVGQRWHVSLSTGTMISSEHSPRCQPRMGGGVGAGAGKRVAPRLPALPRAGLGNPITLRNRYIVLCVSAGSLGRGSRHLGRSRGREQRFCVEAICQVLRM